MATPLIDALDLRRSLAAYEDPAWDWDWPVFPERLQRFIDGEKLAAKSKWTITVKLIGKVEDFEREVRRATRATQTFYGAWHRRPSGSPWRLRDRLARMIGYHCWDCWRHA